MAHIVSLPSLGQFRYECGRSLRISWILALESRIVDTRTSGIEYSVSYMFVISRKLVNVSSTCLDGWHGLCIFRAILVLDPRLYTTW